MSEIVVQQMHAADRPKSGLPLMPPLAALPAKENYIFDAS
jgi:hypothetical protein